jgi:hypothetical protein
MSELYYPQNSVYSSRVQVPVQVLQYQLFGIRSTPVAIRFHQNEVSTFDRICRGILPLWNLDFRITMRPLFKQPFIESYILDNEHKSARRLYE